MRGERRRGRGGHRERKRKRKTNKKKAWRREGKERRLHRSRKEWKEKKSCMKEGKTSIPNPSLSTHMHFELTERQTDRATTEANSNLSPRPTSKRSRERFGLTT